MLEVWGVCWVRKEPRPPDLGRGGRSLRSGRAAPAAPAYLLQVDVLVPVAHSHSGTIQVLRHPAVSAASEPAPCDTCSVSVPRRHDNRPRAIGQVRGLLANQRQPRSLGGGLGRGAWPGVGGAGGMEAPGVRDFP